MKHRPGCRARLVLACIRLISGQNVTTGVLRGTTGDGPGRKELDAGTYLGGDRRRIPVMMTTEPELDAVGVFEAPYVAFLETVRDLRPRLHRYCARMTGSVLDGEDVM